MKVLNDKILIEKYEEQEEKTESGIYLSNPIEEKLKKGKVVQVGDGRVTNNGTRVPVNVQAGDEVLVTKFGPHDIEINKKKYWVAREDDILVVL